MGCVESSIQRVRNLQRVSGVQDVRESVAFECGFDMTFEIGFTIADAARPNL
jgi:hypothetical protein